MTETTKTALDEKQIQRQEAATAARKILVASGPFTSSTADVFDVIRLAEWILDGDKDAEDAPAAEPKEPTKAQVTDARTWCGVCGEWHEVNPNGRADLPAFLQDAVKIELTPWQSEILERAMSGSQDGTPIFTTKKSKKQKGRDA